MLALWKESYDKPRQHIKKQRHYFANKSPFSQHYGFSSGHVWMWELGHKEDWVLNNWCFQIVALEKTLESPLDCREIKPVNAKGYQPWIFIGRTDAVAEAPILWSPDVKSHVIGKDLELAKIEGKRRRGQKRMRRLAGIINTRNMSLRKLQEIGKGRESWFAAVCGVAVSQTRLCDWITATTRYRKAHALTPSSVRPPPAGLSAELVRQRMVVAASSYLLVYTAICSVTAVSPTKWCHLLLQLLNLNTAFCLASVKGTPASELGGESW